MTDLSLINAEMCSHRAAVVRYWDSVASRYLGLFRDELVGKPFDVWLLRQFAEDLGSYARVCDMGCGPCAHVTSLLADSGLDVVGIDLSPNWPRRETPNSRARSPVNTSVAAMSHAG